MASQANASPAEDDGSCGKPCATNCEDLCLADSCSGCALVQLEAQLAKHNADALADTPPPQGAASMDMQRELAPVGLAAEPSGAENRSGGHSICLSRWLGMIVCGMWVCLLLACELYIYWGEGAVATTAPGGELSSELPSYIVFR
jgi:hypothetical protein